MTVCSLDVFLGHFAQCGRELVIVRCYGMIVGRKCVNQELDTCPLAQYSDFGLWVSVTVDLEDSGEDVILHDYA